MILFLFLAHIVFIAYVPSHSLVPQCCTVVDIFSGKKIRVKLEVRIEIVEQTLL